MKRFLTTTSIAAMAAILVTSAMADDPVVNLNYGGYDPSAAAVKGSLPLTPGQVYAGAEMAKGHALPVGLATDITAGGAFVAKRQADQRELEVLRHAMQAVANRLNPPKSVEQQLLEIQTRIADGLLSLPQALTDAQASNNQALVTALSAVMGEVQKGGGNVVVSSGTSSANSANETCSGDTKFEHIPGHVMLTGTPGGFSVQSVGGNLPDIVKDHRKHAVSGNEVRILLTNGQIATGKVAAPVAGQPLPIMWRAMGGCVVTTVPETQVTSNDWGFIGKANPAGDFGTPSRTQETDAPDQPAPTNKAPAGAATSPEVQAKADELSGLKMALESLKAAGLEQTERYQATQRKYNALGAEIRAKAKACQNANNTPVFGVGQDCLGYDALVGKVGPTQ